MYPPPKEISLDISKYHSHGSTKFIFQYSQLKLFLTILILISMILNIFTTVLASGDSISNYTFNRVQEVQAPEPVTRSRLTFQIVELSSYKGDTETAEFYSGNNMVVRCNVTNEDGADEIIGAEIKIVYKKNGNTLLSGTTMEAVNNSKGPTWLWFRFDYTFPIPVPRGSYNITVTATATSQGGQKINHSMEIDILNSPPAIISEINSFYKFEDDPSWNLNLSKKKFDLEDPNNKLTWHIENVNESLLNIEINLDNLTFTPLPDAFGSIELKLILEDTDSGRTNTKFWVYIKPVNDPPEFKPNIPDQKRKEDSTHWVINLTRYIYDLEDSILDKLLNLSVESVNGSLISVEMIKNSTANLMYITPVNDSYGSNLITLRAVDSEDGMAKQRFWINITPENDAPYWKVIPKLQISRSKNVGILDLSKYILDIDTAVDQQDLEITSVTLSTINAEIGHDKKLNITINDPDYIGLAFIEVTADDGANFAVTTIELKIQLGTFSVRPIGPENNSIISTKEPKLQWLLDNPIGFEPVNFEVYLHSDVALVQVHDATARVVFNKSETFHTSIYYLKDDVIYYWTVAPKYFDTDGEVYYGNSELGIQNFRIDVNSVNRPPLSALLSPHHRSIIESQTINLEWLGYDADNDAPISYELYLSNYKEKVSNLSSEAKITLPNPENNNYVITGLKDNEIYYWTVIPSAKGDLGKCLTPIGTFAIDLYNVKPTTILLLPRDNSTVPKPPIIYWDYTDPDPFEDLNFDIFLSDNKARVDYNDPSTRIATVKETTNFYLPPLAPNKKYYWTVISYDKAGAGICECSVWSFTIDQSIINHPPMAQLIGPENEAVITKRSIRLMWNGSDVDDDKITYTVYFGDNLDSISMLDKNSKLSITTTLSFVIDNLSFGKKYYWTVIPDDSKVPGLCMDNVWSFEVRSGEEKNPQDDPESTRVMLTLQIFVIIIIIIIAAGLLWIARKRKMKNRLEQYLRTTTDPDETKDVKTSLLSSRTLRALHSIEGKSKIDDTQGALGTLPSSRYSAGPYPKGEYDHTVEKSRYQLMASQSQNAKQVKRAIPYATGQQEQGLAQGLAAKNNMQPATPLIKKIFTDKAFKASSLPITRQCPRCGSYKVKTYKDDSNKCLECKYKF